MYKFFLHIRLVCMVLILCAAPLRIVVAVDLSGTWDNGSGIDFLKPVKKGDSICLMGCDAEPDLQKNKSSSPPARHVMMEPDRPKYRPEFQARVDDLNKHQVEKDPVLRCLPPGVPRIGPPDKIVQTPGEIIFLYDDVTGNFFRVIPTDGRPHRTDVEASFLGDAIGWWEGNTLVVETVNFNDDTWLTDDGSFHSRDLKVIERLSLAGDKLTWQATAIDPAILAEPWDIRPRIAARTDDEILEAPLCLERDLGHMVDETHHTNPR